MNATVQIHSDDADGTVRTISLKQTATDKGHIEIASSAAPASPQSHDLKNIRADLAALTLNCQLDEFFSASISVLVQKASAGKPALATIQVSHAIYGNGVYVYTLRAGEDDLMRAFLIEAAFPLLQADDA